MKRLGSPGPWPPEVCDELRQHLERYGWAHLPASVIDDLHDLLGELDGWLADERSYTTRRDRHDEWASIIDDVAVAWNQAGGRLKPVMPSMPALLARLHPKLGLETTERAALRDVLEQVRAEARHAEASVAAFDDLVEAVKDPSCRTEVITRRVDVLDSILRFADRSLAEVTKTLTGILNNDTWYIAVARHLLDGDALPNGPIPEEEEDAGLSEAERIELGRRWVAYLPTPAHHVVWVFYGSARVGGWRFSVGPCEFFPGSALLASMAEVDEVRGQGGEYPGARDPFNTPPEELLGDDGWGPWLRRADHWPDKDDWVAVRVDLGVGTFPDVVATARDQAEAVIALAAFGEDGTTWTPLTGYKAFRDGEQAGNSAPFREVEADRRWVEADHTDRWLRRNAEQLGTHVLSGPDAHAVVQAATALNAGSSASPPVQILEAVRIIETQASVLKVYWKDLIKTHVIPGNALSDAKWAAFNAISELSGRYELYAELPDIHRLIDEFHEPAEDGLTLFKVGKAFDRLADLVTSLPTYHRTARRIRDLAADLATPTDAAACIDRHRRLDARLVDRAARVRHSLTHGGPTNPGVLRTTADFIVPKAKHLTGATLRALLDGKPPADGPNEHRAHVDAWLARFPNTATTSEALYGPPPTEDAEGVDQADGTA